MTRRPGQSGRLSATAMRGIGGPGVHVSEPPSLGIPNGPATGNTLSCVYPQRPAVTPNPGPSLRKLSQRRARFCRTGHLSRKLSNTKQFCPEIGCMVWNTGAGVNLLRAPLGGAVSGQNVASCSVLGSVSCLGRGVDRCLLRDAFQAGGLSAATSRSHRCLDVRFRKPTDYRHSLYDAHTEAPRVAS